MSELENVGDLILLLQNYAETLLPRLQSIAFLTQLAAIAASALLALGAAPGLVKLFKRLLTSGISRPWVDGISNVLASISIPGLWLLFLWIGVESGRSVGLDMAFARDGVSLLVAWIVIRLFSHVVRHTLWSSVIFFLAWSIAALDILGVLSQLQASLDGLAFSYGTARISVLNLVRALVVLAVLLWLAALVRGFLEKRIFRASSLTPSLQALIAQLLKLALPTIAIIAVLPVIGLDLTALTVFGGALAVGIGLGAQKTVGNLISGLTLLAGGTIKPGDVIAVTDMGGKPTYGRIAAIGARYVSLTTRDGIEYLLPNDYFITSGVENWSHSDNKIRLKIPFGIAYECDPKEAIRLALEAAAAVPRVVKSPAPVCLLTGFGDSSVDFELRIWIEDPMNGQTNVESQCLLEIWDRFQTHGVRIPFPQRDVHLVSKLQVENLPAPPTR